MRTKVKELHVPEQKEGDGYLDPGDVLLLLQPGVQVRLVLQQQRQKQHQTNKDTS